MQLGDKLAEYIKNFSSYRTTMDFGDVAEILLPTGHTLRLKVREITRTQHHA